MLRNITNYNYTSGRTLNAPKYVIDYYSAKDNSGSIFCSAEYLQKIPLSILLCFIFLLPSTLITIVGIWLYYYKRIKKRQTTRYPKHFDDYYFEDGEEEENEYGNGEQNTAGKQNHPKKLRRMLLRRPTQEVRQLSLLNGSKPGQGQ